MEPAVRARFSPDLLAKAAHRYGLSAKDLTELDGYESFIYTTRDNRILRIGHTKRRSEDLIHGEIDWIEHLHRNGVGVARPIPSTADKLVERIPDGSHGAFLATAFAHAVGEPSPVSSWDHTFAIRYGRLLGRMHRLAIGYEPPHPQWRRPEWDSALMLDLHDDIPADQPKVRAAWISTLAAIAELDRDAGTYGLIHHDAHGGNFFVDESGMITLFDFDDAAYSWFVNDLAIVLFYAVSTLDDPDGFAAWFVPAFLAGYHEHHQLPGHHLAMIPTFMRLREIDTYAIIHRDSEQQSDHPWVRAYMRGRRERIEAGIFPAVIRLPEA